MRFVVARGEGQEGELDEGSQKNTNFQLEDK